MKNLYGTIGYTILSNSKTNNKIIIFADRHDNLPTCNNKTKIADWFGQKLQTSKILLEEVPRNSVNLEELWSDSEHTQDLKKLYLENSNDIEGLDIRPLLIPFSWELTQVSEPAHNINIKKYLEKINGFFTVKNAYLLENLPNYKIDKLKGSKLGIHFLAIKDNFKKILENNREFLYFSVHTIRTINSNFLKEINNLLDQIMEWHICALIMLNNNKPTIVHAGLAHSEKVVKLLKFYYNYHIVSEKGVNSLHLALDTNISGCMPIPNDMDKQFGGYNILSYF